MSEQEKFEGWAVIELLGHQRTGAYVRETTLAGAGVLRLEIPAGDVLHTQFVAPASLYRLSPCDEALARAVAARNQPEVIHSWELPRRAAEAGPRQLPARVVTDEQEPYEAAYPEYPDEDDEEAGL